MKKFMIIISLMFLISIIYSTNIFGYYRDSSWECTNSGETSTGDAFGRFTPSFSNGVCKKTCCILCVSQHPIRDCIGGSSSQPMCSCRQGSSSDTTPPVLTVNSPISNTIYGKRSVSFNVTVSERAKIEYIDNKQSQNGYKMLCTGCSGFTRQLNFNEGSNDINIRATDGAGNKDEKRINFMVDSKAPQISKTEPVSGKYGNGNFKVYYDEENVKIISLNYRQSLSSQVTTLGKNDCESGVKKNCSFSATVPDGDLYYSFEVEDISGKKAVSRQTKITIDNTNPIITLNSSLTTNAPNTYLRRLPLSLSVSEKADLDYKDLNGNNRFSSLCRNCNSYNRNVNFAAGAHNIIIRATDKAGNTDEKNLAFNIS